jgi:polyisoprenoid-binding protein YceI
MIKHLLTTSLLSAALFTTATAAEVDFAHSEIEFDVSHMVVSKTNGQFTEFTADVDVKDGKLISASAEIKVDSIDTDNEKRDKHLKSGDFFDAEKFPTITFTSTKVTDDKLIGNITIKGITKEITLDLKFLGPVKGPWGKTRYGLNATGIIDRTEFGLTWNKAMEAGGVVVGDDVHINISIELTE